MDSFVGNGLVESGKGSEGFKPDSKEAGIVTVARWLSSVQGMYVCLHVFAFRPVCVVLF